MRVRFVSLLVSALWGVAGIAPAESGGATPITHSELLARIARKDPGIVVLDVRTAAEFAAGP